VFLKPPVIETLGVIVAPILAKVVSSIPIVNWSLWLWFGVWRLDAERRQVDMPGEASDWQPIEEDMMNPVGHATDARMADFDIPTAMAAFSSQRISVMTGRLCIGHEIPYHV